ncbi:MAG: hypothetical protein IKO74_11675 [Selenomonadaceae bacterium]|nr:hypothetical protein [Selenomonadaceae bacterium]
MNYNVILVDADEATLTHTANIFKRLPSLTLMASYLESKSAQGLAAVFTPNLFLIDVDDADNRLMLPAFADYRAHEKMGRRQSF